MAARNQLWLLTRVIGITELCLKYWKIFTNGIVAVITFLDTNTAFLHAEYAGVAYSVGIKVAHGEPIQSSPCTSQYR